MNLRKLAQPKYYFDERTLDYYQVNLIKHRFLIGALVLCISVVSATVTYFWTKDNILVSLTEYEKILLVQQANAFSEEKLIAKIDELNFKYPHIVLAQAMLESGRFKSGIFKENNNLFGMKEATSRLNLAQGTNHNHAAYKNWEDSVLDYALWCGTYANSASNEEEYYAILQSVGYAENPEYLAKLKELVANENLKSKFNQ